jgi:hypothetical protein
VTWTTPTRPTRGPDTVGTLRAPARAGAHRDRGAAEGGRPAPVQQVGVAGTVPLPCLPSRRSPAVRIGGLAQDRSKMTPFAVEQIWHAGRPVKVAERGSTLALLVEATVRRITAAAASPTGCPCCRCAIPIRRIAESAVSHRRGRAQRRRRVSDHRAGLLRPLCPRSRHRRGYGWLRARGDCPAVSCPRAAVDGVEAFAETPGGRRDM